MSDTTTQTPDTGTPVIETPTPNEQSGAAVQTPEAVAQPQAPQTDYEQKFAESTREAQILAQKLKEQEERINQLTRPQNPTDDELRREYPDWDTMLPHERKLAQDNLALKRDLAATRVETLTLAAERKWEKDFNQAVKSHPDLKGREDEFQAYALKPTHKGVSVEVLAQAFLYGTQATPATTPAADPTPTGERSTGTPVTPKSSKLSLEDARILRTTNYQEWLKQVKAGNIDAEV